jgi:glycosyltransferase involved in cell wall biosynthesis
MSRILNIALDARPLIHPKGGIGRYTANLLREFVALESPHRFFLYSDRPFQPGFPLPERWKVRTGKVHTRGLTTLFSQVFFPIWAVKDGIDVFWSPSHVLPILLPPRIRRMLTVHDVGWKRFPRKMIPGSMVESVLMPPSLRLADRIIAVSQFTRSEVRALFSGAKCKIDVIHEASSLRTDGPVDPCPLSKPYFLFVGSNVPRKNIKRMLEAYIEYRKVSLCPLDMVLVSTYRWSSFSIPDFIEAHDLQPCVHLIQDIDDSALSTLYAHAQALVMVSLYEGFGIPLVEAMQWGVPSIASNNSSVAEIAGSAALLVDPSDTHAIAEAFRQMIDSREMRSKLSHEAKLRGQQFSWRQAALDTMAIMDGL